MAQEPYAVNSITAASLVVRKSDWHAVALQLNVQSENKIRECELSETAYEVLPLQALTVFADLPPTPAPSLMPAPKVSPLPTVIAASPVPTVALPSRAALQAAEVAALYALHQVQADLGEQLEVVREQERQVVVRGLVQTAARKAELMHALSSIVLVSPQIQTVEEAVQQVGRAATSPSSSETVVTTNATAATAEERSAVNPLQQKLFEHFGGRAGLSESERREVNRKVSQYYNGVEADASAAMAEAWAMRRLQERFAATSATDLDVASRQRLDEMLSNHMARLRQRVRNLQSRLRPQLIAWVNDVPAVAPSAESTRPAKIQAALRACPILCSD